MIVRKLLLASVLWPAAPAIAQEANPAPYTLSTEDYRQLAIEELDRLQGRVPLKRRAKNIILFVGDGMGVSTLTAARIHHGQISGADGVSMVTTMDRLPYTALVKAYSHDAQVADSAPSATALLAGVKSRNGVIGIGPEATPGDCASGTGHELPSLMTIGQDAGKATGVVTTTGITHATPAAAYAHSVDRDWESDADLPAPAQTAGCKDIARQLIESQTGSNLRVILGGGRSAFLSSAIPDPEYRDQKGSRADGRDLTREWRQRTGGDYVWDQKGFSGLSRSTEEPVLGLFQPGHMQFDADRAKDRAGEPSLAEMTRFAIARLQRDIDGFVLLVEGGRIDHAHHAGNARRALEDTIAFDEAIAAALELVDLKETLIVVTADHSHTLTMSGYPARENSILALLQKS